jgi:hypothetical protein
MIIAVAVMVAGLAAMTLELRPAPDAWDYPYWYETFGALRLESTVATLAHVLLPIPARWTHFWGSNFLDFNALIGAGVAAVLGAAALAVSLRRPAALMVVALSFGALFFVMYLKVGDWGLRHQGYLFVAYLMGDWLSRRGSAWPVAWSNLSRLVSDKRATMFLGSLLAVQAAMGLWACERDVQLTFSAGRETAQYIQKHFPADVPIVGDMDAAASTVAGYLGRSIYYVAGHREGTYIIWDKTRKRDLVDYDKGKIWADPVEVFRQAQRIAAERKSDVVVVFSQILDSNMDPVPDRVPTLAANVRQVWSSGDAIQGDEVYDLYVVMNPATQPSR